MDLIHRAGDTELFPPWMSANEYRPDIDGLRAVAVLSVMLFHAFPRYVKGGFIGVDIFFVISGYLISGIIYKSLTRGTFSLNEFYRRRVIRIFPALIVVLAAVLVFGWFSLLGSEYKHLGSYVVAGTLFSANLLSWHEAGYFDANAEGKPLLHLWSLGVEEQFYLMWPFVLILFFRRSNRFIRLVSVIGILSFVINVLSAGRYPISAFYLPFSRFFELMVGAAIAWHHRPGVVIRSAVARDNVMSVIGVSAIVAGLLLIESQSLYPGYWVLLPTAGAALLIMAGPLGWVNRHMLKLRPLVWVGLISYPLYLWHWPILSFARIIEGGTPSRETRFLLLPVAIMLAWSTYQFIELPIRSRRYQKDSGAGRSIAFLLILAATSICVAGSVLYLMHGLPGRVPRLTEIEQASIEISNQPVRPDTASTCGTDLPSFVSCLPATISETEKLLVIGDSHGGALTPGLYKAIQEVRPSVSVVYQPKAGGCSPLRGVETYDHLGISRNCRKEYESVYRWAIADPSVKTVLLVARWATRAGDAIGVGPAEGRMPRARYSYAAGEMEIRNNSETFSRGLRQTVADLLAAGKRVIFVHQVPEYGFYPPFCGSRPILLNRWQEQDALCSLPRSTVEGRQQEYRQLFDAVRAEFPNLMTVDPLPTFCGGLRCSLKKGSAYLYRDHNHLSVAGAYLFSKGFVSELFGAPI